MAHRQWVYEMSGNYDNERDGRWSESIAVGSLEFAERIKSTMGSMARGRTIRNVGDGFELCGNRNRAIMLFLTLKTAM